MEKIKASAIIEIVGAPKEHVLETINKAVDLIKQNKDFELVKSEISEPHEQEFPGKNEKKIIVYSSFAEVEVNFKNFYSLMGFCFEFMPSTIDILEPAELKVSNTITNEALNDLLARLHQNSRIMIEYAALKRRLQKNKINEQGNSSSEDS